MNLNEFSYEENGRRYIDPNVSLNEQNAFIQNLRDTQAERNTQIAQQTHNLGTDVPSNLGGLTGSEAYFNARYQTPQTNSLVADLRAAAQAQALNTVLNNELEKAKKRYNNAYRASGSGGNGGNSHPVNGDVEFVPVGDEYNLVHTKTENENEDPAGLHWLGPNGERISLQYKTDGSRVLDPNGMVTLTAPDRSYTTTKEIEDYMNSMKSKGYKLIDTINGKKGTTKLWLKNGYYLGGAE